MSADTPLSPRALLGRGRSAVVWAERDARGREVARKVFQPDRASRLVFFVLEGARNPYSWSSDAVAAALARRRILERLVGLWFGERMRLPRTDGVHWDADARAYALTMERIRGRHAPLDGPFARPRPDPLDELWGELLPRLQRHLAEAGFEGLLWQAGYGNPVATANFLLEEHAQGRRTWVWIDLESGVPALFAADPVKQVGFYLKRAWQRRRPLFDDVRPERLRAYLVAQKKALDARFGAGTTEGLLAQARSLAEHERRWRGFGRLERGLKAALAAGRIEVSEARRYRRRPGLWARRLASEGAVRAVRGLAGAAAGAVRWLAGVRWGRLARGVVRLLCSQRWRTLLGRRFVNGRVRAWERRRFLTRPQVEDLRRGLKHEETAAYVTDFVMHVMLKPVAKTLQYVVAPLLLLAGVTDEAATALFILCGGAVVRTLYTAGRVAQAALAGRRRPWVALLVGAMPFVGNAAYPLQILFSGLSERDVLARFLLHDVAATMGRSLPVWGGPDTLLEHRASRVPTWWLARRAPRAAPPSAATAAPPRAAAREHAATASEEVR